MGQGFAAILLGIASCASSAAFAPSALSAGSATRQTAAVCRGGARALCATSTTEVTDTSKGLKDRIANFYDQSSPLWEEVWGEHMYVPIVARGFVGQPWQKVLSTKSRTRGWVAW